MVSTISRVFLLVERCNMADSPSSASGLCPQESSSRYEEGMETLRRPNRRAVIAARSSRHLNQQVDTLGADVLLYFCWFSTGLLDSTVFNGRVPFL